jgi:hypothetical protein
MPGPSQRPLRSPRGDSFTTSLASEATHDSAGGKRTDACSISVYGQGVPAAPLRRCGLTAGTLRRIAAARAQIQVTVYPAEPESQVVLANYHRGAKSRSSR